MTEPRQTGENTESGKTSISGIIREAAADVSGSLPPVDGVAGYCGRQLQRRRTGLGNHCTGRCSNFESRMAVARWVDTRGSGASGRAGYDTPAQNAAHHDMGGNLDQG
jgi:hypothetical protein